jgi:GPH family glycoside/pentoside/hexuronide:cation symporter
MSSFDHKLSFVEKVGYALGDGAANIAWRGVATFLFIFYVDVFGLDPAAVGILMLVARSGDGISDVAMGVIGDRTKSKHGKFRPWILWTAIPLGLMLSLLFTTPDLNDGGKLIYAYATYIIFTLVYTANNIPYGALMAVITPSNRERTALGSFRMAGAFTGGMLVQGTLLYLVMAFGNVHPDIEILPVSENTVELTVTAPVDVEHASISTENGVAAFVPLPEDEGVIAVKRFSFSMEEDVPYRFVVTGEPDLQASDIRLINQKTGYSYAIYVLSACLSVFMFLTFLTTKERVQPPVEQKHDLMRDLYLLITNRPWVVLLCVGLLFNIYNSVKQGITVIYFVRFINDELLAGSYLVALMLASIAGAVSVAFLGKWLSKKTLFILALLISGGVNSLLAFCGPDDITSIFIIGTISEFAAAIFPTLFFAMLGDAADFSEWKNGRRATGLIYSAGSFATKFGGGVAAAIIGFVLSAHGYDGKDDVAIEGAMPGIIMLMSWIPGVVAAVTAVFMLFYPLDQNKLDNITKDLSKARSE